MKNYFLGILLFLLLPLRSYCASESFLTLRNLILKIEKNDLQHRSRCEIVSILLNDLSTSYDLGFKATANNLEIQINKDAIYTIPCKTDDDLLNVLGYIYQYNKKIKSILKYYNIDIELEKYFCDFLISRIDKVRSSRIYPSQSPGGITKKEFDFEFQIDDDNEYVISWVRNINCQKNEIGSLNKGNKILTMDSIPTKYITNCIADSLFFQKDSVNLCYSSNTGLICKTFRSHFIQRDSSYIFSQINKNIAYLEISHFFEHEFNSKISKELFKKHYDTVIIDLRNNTGGYLQEISKFTGMFLEVNDTVIIVNSNEEIYFDVDSYHSKNLMKAKLIVLINSSTSSGSNLVVQMLRKGRKALVIGEPSYLENSIHSLEFLNPKMYRINLVVAEMMIKPEDITPDYYVNDCINENGDQILNFALNLKKTISRGQ